MNLQQKIEDNVKKLKMNSYPGRGIIIGISPDSKYYVQVYWIMGRSENSKNRIFENDNGFIRTKAFDENKLKDPSLIIYYPIKHFGSFHIVSNGDQTDTIYNALENGECFEQALNTRCFEPDSPNFTPRISGIINPKDSQYVYKLSILKSFNNDPEFSIRYFYNYEHAVPGIGHCIHTYEGDGNPLPSFSGEPFELKLFNDIDETVKFYWDVLDNDNRVSILGKYINIKDGTYNYKIINKHQVN
jgi:Archaeal IMP cyclohydrolase